MVLIKHKLKLESLTEEPKIIDVDYIWPEGIDIENSDYRYKRNLGDFHHFPIIVFHLSSKENDYCAYILQNGHFFGCTEDQYKGNEINPYDYPDKFTTQLIPGRITKITQMNNTLSDEDLKDYNIRFTFHQSDNNYPGPK